MNIFNQMIKVFCALCLSSSIALAQATPEYLQTPGETEADAIRVGNIVFISGQASGDTSKADSTGAAIEESLQKIDAIAKKMGGSLKNVIKLNLYLVNFDADFAQFGTVFPKYFSEPFPTRTAIGVVKLSPNHTVAIDAVMVLPQK